MTSSAQLEREAEQTRSELGRTLDELRERMTPGQLVDQAVDYAKDTTGGEFVRNLSRQMAANPLPVVLIGAGVSWLALTKGNGGARRGRAARSFKGAAEDAQVRAGAAARGTSERMGEWSAQAGETAEDWAARAGETAENLFARAGETAKDWSSQAGETARDWSAQTGDTANQAADTAGSWREQATEGTARAKARIADAGSSLSEGAGSTYESMKSGASNAATTAGNAAADAYGRVADTAARAGSAMAQSARGVGQKATGFGTDALAFCKGQPLVLAGLWLALGAILGAIMPPTDAEDRLMGDRSDRIKDQARGAAQDQMEKVKTAVEGGMAQAQTQAEQMADSAGEAASTSLVPKDDDETAKLPLE